MVEMPNQQTHHQIKPKIEFIRDCLTTNSIKQFWKGTDEERIKYDAVYLDLTLDDLEGSFIEEVYQDDIAMIKGRITLLQGLNRSNKENDSKDNKGNEPKNAPKNAHLEDTVIEKDVVDLLIGSISSFTMAVASQGGNPKSLYEEYKLKELFKHLAKNGIEVSFNIKK